MNFKYKSIYKLFMYQTIYVLHLGDCRVSKKINNNGNFADTSALFKIKTSLAVVPLKLQLGFFTIYVNPVKVCLPLPALVWFELADELIGRPVDYSRLQISES